METKEGETSTSPNFITSKVSPTLLELSSDLGTIFKRQINSDLTLIVDQKSIKCHKAILSSRSTWFGFRINQLTTSGGNSIVFKENELIAEALLLYIYTGNLLLIEPLNVPLLDFRAAASQYGLDKLKKLLTRMIRTEEKLGPVETREFIWKLKIEDCKSVGALCPLEGFTLNGTDRWCLKMSPLSCNQAKYAFWIYIIRETIVKNKLMHLASVEFHIIDADGNSIKSFINDHIFKRDGESKMTENISLCKLMESPKTLLPNGILTLRGQISIYVEDPAGQQRMTFQIKSPHEKGVTNEFHALSFDMYNMMKAANFTDIGVCVRGTPGFKLHSYILYARLLIPIVRIGNLLDHGDFGPIVWRSFIHFVYTGQARYLDDHMLEVYRAVSKLQLMRAKKKYSNLLGAHLTTNNVFDVVLEASSFEDVELVYAALFSIAHNDMIDHPTWVRFASKYPCWTREIMKATRHKRVQV